MAKNLNKANKRLRSMMCCMFALLLLLLTTVAATAEAPDFANSDYRNVASEKEDAVITLEGDTGTISDSTRGQSGNPVVIERKGIYRISGQSDGVSIQIREPKKSGNIYLILDNVSMINGTAACIDAQAAEKLIIQCVGDNNLTSTSEEGAAIYVEDDLTVSGTGRLHVSSAKNGIQCKSTLRITGSVLTIEAGNDGLKGKYGIYVDGGSTTISKSYEGLEAGEVVIREGELFIYSSDDGINAAGKDEIQGDVLVQGGNVYINASGDAIDSNRSILFEGGLTLVEGPVNGRNSIFDKGDGTDAVLSITGGTVIAIGSAEKAKNFKEGTQYSRLEKISGHPGDVIEADDGSKTKLTASKDFECVIYSSPSFGENNRILVQSATEKATSEVTEWDLSVQTEITEEIRTLFVEATDGLLGVSYEPVTVLGRKGDVICVLSKATVVYPGAKPYYAMVYFGTGNGKAEILSIRELWLEAEP